MEMSKSKKWDSKHFKHEVVVYVPCYQKNPKHEDDGHPTFEYNMEHATQDPQMAASMNPDYILVLKGEFDAKTQPFDFDIVEYNLGYDNRE